MLRLMTFGGLTLLQDGAPHVGPANQRRRLALLALVAAAGKKGVSREKLVAYLWPESSDDQARHALAQSFHVLRRSVASDALFLGTTALRINPEVMSSDVADFGEATGAGDYERATALYAGPFLDGFHLDDAPEFEQWAEVERARLAREYVTGLERLASAAAAHQDHAAVVGWRRRIAAADPLSSRAALGLIEALVAAGDRAGALQFATVHEALVRQELEAAPDPAVTAWVNRLRSGQVPAPAVAPRADLVSDAEGPVHNWAAAGHVGTTAERPLAPSMGGSGLASCDDIRERRLPHAPTRILGREEEIRTIRELLTERRLVTVLGPGGVGKSRLALEVVTSEANAYRDGTYFVPLAAVTSPDLVVQSIAEALGLTFAVGVSLKEHLLGYLREKHLLLVLDNFEQLVAGAPVLVEMIERASEVRLLVTSRERLNVSGEAAFKLQGLSVPDGDGRTEPDDEHSAAVQLFVERARGTDPTFSLVDDERPSVGRICRLLGGLPLAIELAASMLRVLSCREIVEEVERSVDALETRLRDVPARHRSLRAVFESSWAMLGKTEREALMRLSVLRGGFRREAGERVAGASLHTLLGLVDKSLVHRNASGRYEVHETIRQYAETKLKQAPAKYAQAEAACAAYFADFLRGREERLRGGDERSALNEIAEEMANVRAGWAWAIEHKAQELLDKYVWSLARFYDVRGWYREGADAFRDAHLAAPDSVLAGKVLSRRASFCFRLGRVDEARTLHRESLAILRRLGAEGEMVVSLKNLGIIAKSLGKYRASQRLLRSAIRIAQARNDRFELARCFSDLGITLSHLGSHAEAEALLRNSSELCRAIGNQSGLVTALNNLGHVLVNGGRLADAWHLFQECRGLAEQLGDRHLLAAASLNLAHVSLLSSRHEEARSLALEALKQFRHVGVEEGLAACLSTLGEIEGMLGNRSEAAQYFREALDRACESDAIYRTMQIAIGYATILADAGEHGRALELLTLAVSHPATREEDRIEAGRLLRRLGSTLQPDAIVADRGREYDRQQSKELEGKLRTLLTVDEPFSLSLSRPGADRPVRHKRRA